MWEPPFSFLNPVSCHLPHNILFFDITNFPLVSYKANRECERWYIKTQNYNLCAQNFCTNVQHHLKVILIIQKICKNTYNISAIIQMNFMNKTNPYLMLAYEADRKTDKLIEQHYQARPLILYHLQPVFFAIWIVIFHKCYRFHKFNVFTNTSPQWFCFDNFIMFYNCYGFWNLFFMQNFTLWI